MAPLRQLQKQYGLAAALLSFTFLACGPFDQLQELNQQRQAAATSVAIIDKNSRLIANAYENLERLPGYRLETRATIRGPGGHQTTQVMVTEQDSSGNAHIQVQTPDGQQREFYFVEGQLYQFEPQYGGWVNSGADDSIELQQMEGTVLTTPAQVQLLTQFGTVLTQADRERLHGRPATRYKLEYVVTEIAKLFEQELADSPVDLRGMVWIDDETGALLKSDLLLYQDKTSHPAQEYLLEISDVGHIDPIGVPSPVVNPEAIVSATATAQAWTILTVNLDYEGEPISFELIPFQAVEAPSSSPGRVQLELRVAQLPKTFFQGATLERFLAQLGQQLSLSVPNRNLVAPSTGWHIENQDNNGATAEVTYFFDADLEDVSHVELVISGAGNPLFAPVPVEEKE